MRTATELLSISQRVAPRDEASVAEAIAGAADAHQAIFPLGGQTSLDYGLSPACDGIGLDLGELKQVVDYNARDMTITVQAGIRMAALSDALAKEHQQLPIDVPLADQATLGGVIATNFSGPRRYGFGTLRDYVIGVTAVDGRGVTFHGGGRVVKNVAGYDFCKLLIGSLGTIGVITQVTLKVKPLSETRRWLVCRIADERQAEKLLEAIVTSQTLPTGIELLMGADWTNAAGLPTLPEGPMALAVLFEGTSTEVNWQIDKLHDEWQALGVSGQNTAAVNGPAVTKLLETLREFPQSGVAESDVSPLVVKAALPPSCLMQFVKRVREVDPDANLLSHAGNGVAIVRFKKVVAADLTQSHVGKLQAEVARNSGSLVVLQSTLEGLTPQVVWGGRTAAVCLMESIKRQFDPLHILNPGRFLFI